MRRKNVTVRLPEEVFGRVKKEAISGGRSVSETVGILVLKSLESGRASVPAIDPESVKKAVESVLRKTGLDEVNAGIRDLGQALSDTRTTGAGASTGYPWTKDQVRHLVYTAARMDRLLEDFNTLWSKSVPETSTRARVANEEGERTARNLGLGEDNHGR